MAASRVTALLILDSNPAHTVPGFGEALRLVPLSIYAAAAPDDTAVAAGWHIP